MADIDQASTAFSTTSRDRIPPSVFMLTACVAVIGSNSLVLSPIAPEVARALDVSVQSVMSAAAAFGLGTAASALFLARYIDRVGAWRLLRLAFALFAASLAVSAAAPAVSILVLAQLCAGVAAGIALPAIYTSAATIAPPGRESKTLGIVLTGWTFSLVAGVSLSAVLADWLDWRAVYGAVFLLSASALIFLLNNGQRDTLSGEPAASPLAALAIPGVRPLLVACGAFMTAFYGVYGFLGAHLHDWLGLPLSANGLVTLSYGMGFGAAAFLDGIEKRVPVRFALPAAFFCVSIVYLLLTAASSSYSAILALVFFWGLANHFGLNLLILRLTSLEPARRGAIMGLNSAVTYLAVFAGSLGFGPIYASAGFAALTALAAALMIVSMLSTTIKTGRSA